MESESELNRLLIFQLESESELESTQPCPESESIDPSPIPALIRHDVWIWIFNWNLDSGIGIEPTWNRNWNRWHNFELESELESNYSQWNRNWNRRCRNRSISGSYEFLVRTSAGQHLSVYCVGKRGAKFECAPPIKFNYDLSSTYILSCTCMWEVLGWVDAWFGSEKSYSLKY